jgi:hypothetical protein
VGAVTLPTSLSEKRSKTTRTSPKSVLDVRIDRGIDLSVPTLARFGPGRSRDMRPYLTDFFLAVQVLQRAKSAESKPRLSQRI